MFCDIDGIIRPALNDDDENSLKEADIILRKESGIDSMEKPDIQEREELEDTLHGKHSPCGKVFKGTKYVMNDSSVWKLNYDDVKRGQKKILEENSGKNGYLGAQPLFAELGLSTKTHHEPEFETGENEFVIKLKANQPIKITSKIVCDDGLDESQERVFIQTRGEDVNLLVSLDKPGYHRLQIYALSASDEKKQLPGVFNYLVNCTGTPRKSRLFPKQFAQWRDGCVLLEPFSLAGDHVKGDVLFRVVIPNALAVAITIEENWFHLEPGENGIWAGRVSEIDQFKGKGLHAVLNANFSEDDETKYSSLLQYTL
ncbi:hypothetical protein Btru_034358 [Bulinus truncatus]|nr:hypothetical protein Btru_034358 [Bulinus truncatus]